ncbi:helix-turn-helix domain-containing protein [Halegenticoccus soli]|uniref:helix-turn-helix domain-containing protein n=1 Tax=Halegenticoccus soli TaxID=1985678 RepID=UPI000C6E8A0F|nr:helix-turn-helix domain-containing protein [Halegenticoccus soli]
MITAKFTLQVPFLQEALAAVPDMELQIEPGQFPFIAEKKTRLLVWASGDDFERFEVQADEDSLIQELVTVTTEGSSRLYRVEAEHEELRSLFQILFYDHDTLLERGTVTAAGWQFWLRAVDRDAVSTVATKLHEHGVQTDFRAIYTEHGGEDVTASLTDGQYEALVTAYTRGYFNVPCAVSQQKLAADLGTSGQAVSERLRRAVRAILDDTLNVTSDQDSP